MTEAHLSIPALPYEYTFPTQHVALVVIDMQRDFVLPGGFGFLQAAAAGADLTELSAKMTRVVRRCQELVEAARRAGLYVIHTREGHRRDLSDCPFSKIERQASAPGTLHTVHIGDQGTAFDGPMLVQGSYSHDFVDELQPRAGEAVFDKPGKGAFFATALDAYLADRQITHLILVGVTTECCVMTTLREANDRGYQCCLVADCTDGYNDGFGRACLAMTTLSDGLFGWVSDEGREIVRQLATVHRDASPPVGSASPAQVLIRIKQVNGSHNRIFTRLASLQELEARSEAVKLQNQGSWPLAGRLFAVKDMISTPGLPSRMCNFGKEEASLDEGASSTVSSPVVDRLQEAGAVLVGKTNMDVLATGLTGTRSDVGNPLCKPDPTRIPGGSSSGSAVAVAEGLCDFSIGTDTAGSGRIPAAFNGVVGFKPSKASLSTDGVLPCMPSLDCVTIFASTAALVQRVWLVAKGDASSGAPSPTHRKAGRAVGRLEPAFQRRFTFAVPDDETIKRLCEPCFATSFAAATERLASAFGATKAMLSRDEFQGFYDAGQAVYFSGLAAERLFHVKRHVEDLNKLHGATRKHLEAAAKVTVDEVLEAQAKVQTMRQWGDGFWDAHRDYDVLVFPTAPCHPTVTVMQASVDDNLSIGSSLAAFTACANVLDMPAVSIPSPFVGEEAHRPFSIMLMAPRHDDGFLLRLAQLYQEREHPESE